MYRNNMATKLHFDKDESDDNLKTNNFFNISFTKLFLTNSVFNIYSLNFFTPINLFCTNIFFNVSSLNSSLQLYIYSLLMSSNLMQQTLLVVIINFLDNSMSRHFYIL